MFHEMEWFQSFSTAIFEGANWRQQHYNESERMDPEFI